MGKRLERFGEIRIIYETNGFGLDFAEKTERWLDDKMVRVWLIVLIAVIFSINLNVKRCAFVSSDCIGLSLIGEEAEETKYGESFISSSLWQARGVKFSFRIRTSKQSFLSILILMCGDVEECPGLGYGGRSSPDCCP